MAALRRDLLKGRRYFDEAIHLLDHRLFALILGGFGMCLGFVSLLMLMNIKASQRVIPYIVSVDRQGSVLSLGPAQSVQNIPQSAIASVLCTFIEKLYEKPLSYEMQVLNVNQVYALIKLKSEAKKSCDYIFKSKMKDRNSNEEVSVNVDNIVRLSDSVYRIEYTTAGSGADRSQEHYVSTLSIELNDISYKSLDEVRLNPLGIFVTEVITEKKLELKGGNNAAS